MTEQRRQYAENVIRRVYCNSNPSQRESIVRLLTAVAGADGGLCTSEHLEIAQIAGELGISPDEVFCDRPAKCKSRRRARFGKSPEYSAPESGIILCLRDSRAEVP